MLRSYQIQDLVIKNGLVLSPMSGVTTKPFRRLVKELNGESVGLVITEFISVEGLTRKGPRSLEMMNFDEGERPVGIQVFGYDINRIRDAALMGADAGFDLIDLNCGCPAPKVVRKGGGCELMRQPDHLRMILREVRRAISIPFTLKMRSGWSEESKNAVEIAKICEGEGVEAIAIHGRTRKQMYRGEADWDLVADVANAVSIPVLGSGDVIDRASAEQRLKLGVSGIFVGRGALSNPFVFRDIVQGETSTLKSRPNEIVQVLERYIELLQEDFTPTRAIGKIKQLTSQMCKGLPWRKPILTAQSF